MNEVYRYTGYSKQAFHQKLIRSQEEKEQLMLLLPLIAEVRDDHPGMGAREMYRIRKPAHIGRDKFEAWCFENGYKLPRTKSFKKTTDSSGVIRFDNLLEGKKFTHVNQVWTSDITYYQIEERCYYLTFILDLYSRRIVGYSVSKRLLTKETTMPALYMALKERRPGAGLIFHSDGGGQYYCREFLKLTSSWKIKNSMCDTVYENPHAERINGTIKNQYLRGYRPTGFRSLQQQTARAVYNYNHTKPHSSLEKLSPCTFETLLPAGGSSTLTDHFNKRQSTKKMPHENNQSKLRLNSKPKKA